ncbi:MAG: hypothetical protein AB7K37_00695 [Cyclobacteriaceae bacterium]
MTDAPKPPAQADEIDLGVLFAKIGDFFRNIGLGFLRFLALMRRVPLENKTLFISIILLGAVVGFSYSTFLKKKFYETTMILSSNYLNKRIVDNTVEKLNLLAEEEDARGLAKELKISDSLAYNILEFSSKPFVAETDLIELEVLKEQLKNAKLESKNEKVIDQVISRIEIENRHAFEISVKVLNPTVITELQDALVNYFRTNDYIQKRIEINKTNLQHRRTKLMADTRKLDSLKSVIYANYKNMAEQSREGSNNVIMSDRSVTNPIEIYNQDLSIYDQLQSVERQLYLQPDFEIIDGFTEFNEPSSASRTKITGIAMLIGLGLAYLIVALMQFNRYLGKLA